MTLLKQYFKNNPQVLLFITYLLITHLVLPRYLGRNNLSFFYTWRLFDDPPAQYTYDLSFDNGNSFIFRDHRDSFNKKDLLLLYRYNYRLEYQMINKYYKELIRKQLKYESLYSYRIEGSIYDHIVLKKKPILSEQVKVY